MLNEPSLEQLTKEREELIRYLLTGKVTDAWPRIRQQLMDSPSLFSDRHVHTIYEGPTRSWLLPLQFELLREFLLVFGDTVRPHLTAALLDPEPNVVGYALHALSELEPEQFDAHVVAVSDRSEVVCTIFGSFLWEGTLADYASRLCAEM